jgi:flagellin-like protein
MRGISTVIATLLMLMITIALAGMTYMYISGIFTMQTQGIEVRDAYCVGSTVNIRIRNIGTRNITSSEISCTQIAPPTSNPTCNLNPTTNLTAGNESLFTTTCGGSGTRNCVYRLVPPAGRAVEVNVPCY